MISGKWFQIGATGQKISCIYSPSTSKKALELPIISTFFAGGSPAATSLTDHTVCMNSNLYHSQLKDLQLITIFFFLVADKKYLTRFIIFIIWHRDFAFFSVSAAEMY